METETSTPSNVGTGMEGAKGGSDSQPESPNSSPLGVFAPFPYSPEPFAELSDAARGALIGLDNIATKTDTAARRMEVEQAWEALHFERGYQHLLRGKQGGWQLPGAGTGYSAKDQKNTASIYDTNIYGPKGDIIVAALAREVPKVEFFPVNPEYGPDRVAKEEADRFKEIWARNNNLHSLLTECARIFWNEDRVLMWTRYELNGQKYGFEGETEVPTVPEDVFNEPDAEPTGQEALDDVLDAQTSEEPSEEEPEPTNGGEDLLTEAGNAGDDRKPLGREVTTVHGKLDHKVPIAVDTFDLMQFVQLSLDLDVAVVRGMFPWIASKINPGTDGMSETQLDRIARENVRQAVVGAYVTGDSLNRHSTVKFSWFRPSMFLDQSVSDEAKAELLEAFPNGALLARAGQEYAFSRNESMDDHLVIGHPWAGKGQNRRAMGTMLISIQKRINDWVDLLDDFFKRTVPKKWMNADAFDMEALKTQPNVPGSTGPFLPQPGLTLEAQYIMVEPTPQPQAALPDFIKWFITSLSEEISGALPSLFGAATGENTVGNAVIQRDQALQRVGCPWNSVQDMFAAAAQQAVKCAAECRDGKTIRQNIKGKGNIAVNTANLLAGNVLCYAENNPAFPETWQQKEGKLKELITQGATNQALNAIIFSPSNSVEVLDALRMKGFKIPGASSAAKQRNEFEVLLRTGPHDNPQFLQMQDAMKQATSGMQQAQQTGQPVLPQHEAMVAQLGQAMKATPPQISTVPVAQDESENHLVEANECFEWMNSTEGQKFHSGNPQQQAGYENVHMHWSEHLKMAKQIAAQNQPPDKPPSESISVDVSKMPPNVAMQALAKMKINATAQDFAQQADQQLQHKVAAKAVPEALKAPKEAQQPPQQGGEQLPRQLRR
jgi:hypothetical protein